MDLQHAVTLLWQGMLGIFVVMSVIALLVYGMGKLLGKNSGGKE